MSQDFDSVLDVEGIPNRELLEDIKKIISGADALKPRSLQKALGPSEVGHKCMRRLAYGTVASRRETNGAARGRNRGGDPMAAIIGTAVHSWLEEAVSLANKSLGRTRWVPEQKVEVRPGLSGTCDLYDYDTQGTYDWKVPGATRHKHYVQHGPSDVYRAQAHLYGAGYKNFGLPVKQVGIIFISKTGRLNDIHLWTEPYNQDLVDEVLKRLDQVDVAIAGLDLMSDPEGFLQVPITPDSDCSFCPWYSPMPEGPYSCGGERESR